jgi:hypothetical protein
VSKPSSAEGSVSQPPGPPDVTTAYRCVAGKWLIEVRLREPRQLFNHLDPAPFREKDLDPAAERYIEEAVRELGHRRPARLVLHLPADQVGSDDARSLPAAIAHYFAYRSRQVRIERRQLLRRGALSLCIALLFLTVCLSLRELSGGAPGAEILREGLLIIGWVALWRPVEIFLYDWWPMRQQELRFAAIEAMPVEVVLAQ